MDGDIDHHGYLQEEMGFDDLINNAGWPGAGTASQYNYQQQPQPTQEDFSHYQTSNQPHYNHYNLSQQTPYAPVPYSNSPYATSHQYGHNLHGTPSDVFGSTSFVDPSLQTPTSYHSLEPSFPFVPHANEHATIAPQSLQYELSQAPTVNRVVSNSPFQHPVPGSVNTFHQAPQNHSSVYFEPQQNLSLQNNVANQVQYPTIPNSVTDNEPKPTIKRSFEDVSSKSSPKAAPVKPEPPAELLRITHPELLNGQNSSFRQPLSHAPFLYLKDEPVQVQITGKTTLPKYHPRKSKSGRELVPGLDLSRNLTPARPSAKKKAKPRKETASALSTWKGTSKAPKPANAKVNILREDGNVAGSPSTPTETSSSEEESSSSEEESEYEEEEMPTELITSVRAATRPTTLAASTRWDAIGIVWKDRYANHKADVIKDAIEKYAGMVSSLRFQLKANATKMEAAAAQPDETSQLKAARKELLDALYEAINAAVECGYPSVVENLGGHHKLVNGLTTTLIECIKADDFNGKLPKAVFSLLAKFTTMTDDLLKRLKFDSIQKRWNKKGDEETKQKISTILANTVDAKEKAAKKQEEETKAPKTTDLTKKRSLETPKAAAPSSTKRPHEGDGNDKPNKRIAADTSASKAPPIKRPASNLLGIATKPAVKPVVKKREPSPPQESKLGALLASIAKPPELPKAPSAPPRAPETPEEQARRERKESRRHLRVKFKEGSELEQIRLFKHELGEDEGRQDDMLRDANDSHNEGMMHKRRVSETNDEGLEEDEYQPPEYEELPYTEPKGVDFSSVDKRTRFGPSYSTRGGDLAVNTQEQKTQAHREGLELMVVYTDPKDIPPTPKEPSQADTSTPSQPEHDYKVPTDGWLGQRLQEIGQYGPEQASQIFALRQQDLLQQQAREDRARGVANPSTNSSASQPGAPTATNSLLEMQRKAAASGQENLRRLMETVKPLIGKPFPATEPPAWMTNAAQRAEWISGYERDEAAKKRMVAEKMATQVQPYQQPLQPSAQSIHSQTPMPNTQYQLPIYQQPVHVQATDNGQQMQGIMPAYGNAENNLGNTQPYDLAAWMAANSGGGIAPPNTQSHNQQSRRDENWSKDSTSTQKSDRSQNNAGGKGKKHTFDNTWTDGPLDANGKYKGKMRPCKYFFEGKCAKGEKCTFSHESPT